MLNTKWTRLPGDSVYSIVGHLPTVNTAEMNPIECQCRAVRHCGRLASTEMKIEMRRVLIESIGRL